MVDTTTRFWEVAGLIQQCKDVYDFFVLECTHQSTEDACIQIVTIFL